MPTLHVRNVPAELYDALSQLAAERRTSITTEAIRLLERALRTDRMATRGLLDEIERRRPVAKPGDASAADLIREDRDSR